MINILHIYPKENAMIAQYVSMVERMLPKSMTVSSAENAKAAKQMCMDGKPDIVHLHGCRQTELTSIAFMAIQKGARLVVNPHGDLQPWERKSLLFPSTKMRHCIEHAYTLIAQSKMESDALAQLGWNDRIETILNPIITKMTTPEELAQKTQKIYLKVMASDVLSLMDNGTKRSLQLILKAAITGDKRWLAGGNIGTTDWQKLYVYAEQEGISTIVKRGIDILEIQAPQPVSQPIYLPNGYQKPEPCLDKSAMEMIRIIKDETDDRKLSLLRLVEMDSLLRNPQLDEEVLLTEVKAARLNGFFSSMLQVLHEQTGLDEGFMPCSPEDNKETEHIRTILANHLKI
jgi:hypothetical protein